YSGDWEDFLSFEYHYDVLPNSIISRFIVRMHPKIKKNICWRTGVLLVEGDNEALVQANLEEKKITIKIRGSEYTRRYFLREVYSQLDSINKTIAKLEPVKKVPIPKTDVVVDYDHLLFLEEEGDETFPPEGLKVKVNVKKLLNGVISEEDRKKDLETVDDKSEKPTPTTSEKVGIWKMMRDVIIAYLGKNKLPKVLVALGGTILLPLNFIFWILEEYLKINFGFSSPKDPTFVGLFIIILGVVVHIFNSLKEIILKYLEDKKEIKLKELEHKKNDLAGIKGKKPLNSRHDDDDDDTTTTTVH
ncbi:MAG: hypothetical protein GY730_08240, partial [bacterium]|nr:hypothetical protein [bacterium]